VGVLFRKDPGEMRKPALGVIEMQNEFLDQWPAAEEEASGLRIPAGPYAVCVDAATLQS
jgi:hypothetical protein